MRNGFVWASLTSLGPSYNEDRNLVGRSQYHGPHIHGNYSGLSPTGNVRYSLPKLNLTIERGCFIISKFMRESYVDKIGVHQFML